MRVSIEIGGRRYLVEIEDEGDCPQQVFVDGRKVNIDISPNWAAQFTKSLIVTGRSHRVEFEYEEGGIPKAVWVDGYPSEAVIDFPGKGKIRGSKVTPLVGESRDKVVAPIPGKIVEVRVDEGQRVAEGQVLVVLEAMKMENELCAPRDAVIKQILCREGDNVDLEQVLVNLS
jgi:biotin carboxyl carrier protein